MKWLAYLLCLVFLLLFTADARAVTIPTVPVGNPGNANDTTGFGAVAYAYRIGTYEVTNAQYAEFLNAKAPSDPLALYNANMGSNARGGILQSGVSGSFTYATRTNMGNKPVNYVSWYDSIRFANWVNNGQGSGDTETGAYSILGGTPTPSNGDSIARNAGASWFLPSENEWYKSAYHQPSTQGGDSDDYWLYPTASNSVPTIATANSVGDISNPGTNVANFAQGADWNSLNANVTTVGSAGPSSENFYNTSDQCGNVWEWNEALISDSIRGARGGSWLSSSINLRSSYRNYSISGGYEGDNRVGFRVATILPLVTGDVNWDDVVDGADYSVWADHYLGTVQNWTNGDLNGDGLVDAGDYTIWADHYAPAGASAAPEPSTFVLAAVGILVFLVLRKRRQSVCSDLLPRRSLGAVIAVASCVLVSSVNPALGDPLRYEPATDPSLGFNLISWWNFGASGPSVWANSVQSLYDAGFRQVSINPVRYFDPNTGKISASSQRGPELSHIAAGIARAKSLGMTVTVAPYIEYQDFTQWRANWDPAPATASSNQFWNDYKRYLVSVAQVAQANGADSMNVGDELRGLVQNPGNYAHWNAAINGVAANFSGQLGYAANWDDYQNENLTDAIWNHPAIDYMGVDAYFPLATGEQADASGADPNPAFINLLTDSWNAQLDGNILPFAHSLKGGNGMPVVFSETGILPYNRATAEHWDVIPSTSYPDPDEQIMGFKALMGAIDHRKANDDLLAINIWSWGMPGSNGSLWNMGAILPADQPLNMPATHYLADYVTHPIPEPSTFVLAGLGILSMAVLRRRRHDS